MSGQAQPTPDVTATPPAPDSEAICTNLASFNRVRRIRPESVFPIPHGSDQNMDADTPGMSHATTKENSRPATLRNTLHGYLLSHSTADVSPVRVAYADIAAQHAAINESGTFQRPLSLGSDGPNFSYKIHAHTHPEEPAARSQVTDAQLRYPGCEDQFSLAEMLQSQQSCS